MQPHKIIRSSVVFLAGIAGFAVAQTSTPVSGADLATMKLTTSSFADGEYIPAKHTQAGGGLSPPLAWSNPPPGTKSFLLHVHDVDTPQQLYKSSPTRVHWLVWNIPATAVLIPEGASGSSWPDGSLQVSEIGPVYFPPNEDQYLGGNTAAFRSSRPAPNVHRYRFELFALDTKLDIQPGKTAAETRDKVVIAMSGHVLGQAKFTGRFPAPAE